LTSYPVYGIINIEREGTVMRIELVNEVVKALEFCEHAEDGSEFCGSCPLMGACIEYWTGDARCNQEDKET
jgi:hypothetical protein